MGLRDKCLQCFDCGATFTFSAQEQVVSQYYGFANEPKRCPLCRQALQRVLPQVRLSR